MLRQWLVRRFWRWWDAGGGEFARTKDDQVVPKSGFTKYEGSGFEFYYPSAWVKQETAQLIMLTPKDITGGASSINIVVTPQTGAIKEMTKAALEDALGDTIKNYQKGTICGREAVRYEITVLTVSQTQIAFETDSATVVITVALTSTDTANKDLPKTVFESLVVA